MSLLSFAATVLTKYKADTSEQEAAVKKMADGEQKLYDKRAAGIAAGNRAIDGAIGKLREHDAAVAKFAGTLDNLASSTAHWKQVFDLAMRAGKAALDAWEYSTKRAALTAAAGKVNLEALSQAAGGLKSKMQLLEFAATTQTAAFKLSQGQMETVQRAMRALVQEGKNEEEVTKKVTEAIVKLEGEGLKDLGIRVREATSDGDKLNAILEGLTEKSYRVGAGQAAASEGFLRLKATWADAQGTFTDGMGKLVASLGPLLQGLASAVGMIAQLSEYANGAAAQLPGGDTVMKSLPAAGITNYSEIKRGIERSVRWRGGAVSSKYLGQAGAAGPGRSFASMGMGDIVGVDLYGDSGVNYDQVKAAAEHVRTRAREDFEREEQDLEDWWQKRKEALEEWKKTSAGMRARLRAEVLIMAGGGTEAGPTFRSAEALARAYGRGDYSPYNTSGPRELGEAAIRRDEFGRDLDTEDAYRRMIYGDARQKNTARFQAELDARGKDTGAGAGIRAFQEGELAKIFGPIEDFNAYQQAFKGLTTAVQGAFAAWIDGSKSAKEAFRAIFAESLKGMAVDLLGQAIYHGVYAVGDLAFQNYVGAAQHGAAAAKALAGAAAIGLLAKKLHPGVSAEGAGGAAGAAGGGGGGVAPRPHGPAGQHQVIVIGGAWGRQTPRAQALEAGEAAELASGVTGGGPR